MDRLELGVGDSGLGHGGQVVEVDEADQVVEQRGHAFRGRRDEGGVGGAGPAPPDPVLLGADDAGVGRFGRPLQQRPMDVEEVGHAKGAALAPMAMACSIARTLPSTARAVLSAATGS